jgi:hypothetical protein
MNTIVAHTDEIRAGQHHGSTRGRQRGERTRVGAFHRPLGGNKTVASGGVTSHLEFHVREGPPELLGICADSFPRQRSGSRWIRIRSAWRKCRNDTASVMGVPPIKISLNDLITIHGPLLTICYPFAHTNTLQRRDGLGAERVPGAWCRVLGAVPSAGCRVLCWVLADG